MRPAQCLPSFGLLDGQCVLNGNLCCMLLLLCMQAARVRCTVGEISDALERAWGRHAASTAVAPGYYVATRNAGAAGMWPAVLWLPGQPILYPT
jgi:hypothetical protein